MYKEILEKNIATALKENKTVELSVWRAIKSEFLNYEKAKADNLITDAIEFNIINKMLAQHKDSIDQFKIANRFDLVEKEEEEAKILANLLPKEPTEEDIFNAVKNAVTILNGEPVATMKDMKQIQAIIKEKYPTANGGIIAKLFRENFVK